MKKNTLISLVLILTILASCSQLSNSKQKESVKLDSLKVAPINPAASTINIDDPHTVDSKELIFKEWNLPNKLKESWAKAEEIKYSEIINFEEIKDTVLINYTVLSKDSSNFVFKNVNIKVSNINSDYNIYGTVSDQVNHGTKSAIDMFIAISIQADYKHKFPSKKIYARGYVVIAKNGVIKKL